MIKPMKTVFTTALALCALLAGCAEPLDSTDADAIGEARGSFDIMLSAAAIKPIIDASTFAEVAHFTYQGNPTYVAAVDGAWQATPENDLFGIEEETFDAVKAATANPADGGDSLLIDDAPYELVPTRINGERRCVLSAL